jgi:2-dehydro-3-deoxyphosphogluconate aldolase/(4S)-4-hydroxy-2-oxoglutarate aldolase
MARTQTLGRIRELGLVPVVRAASSEDALRTIESLGEGGVDIIELTMTVPGALKLIEGLVARFGRHMLVGAGTVLDSETARACILAGAEFVVSPTVEEATIACCRTYGVAVLAGALTPTEIVRAWRAGADLVKVFPCSAMGGASYIKSLRAPLPQIELLPTGGVSLETVGAFIRAGATAVGAGADLVEAGQVGRAETGPAGGSAAVSAAARKYIAAIREARAEIARPPEPAAS